MIGLRPHDVRKLGSRASEPSDCHTGSGSRLGNCLKNHSIVFLFVGKCWGGHLTLTCVTVFGKILGKVLPKIALPRKGPMWSEPNVTELTRLSNFPAVVRYRSLTEN